MKISYDPTVDAAYIRLKEGKFHVTTHRLTEDVAVNYAPDGSIVGIEVLDARFRLSRQALTDVDVHLPVSA